MSFAELGLSEKVQQAVAASGYTEPTPIQAQAIPHVLARKDVLGIAQTGTGKTAAFTLPMLTMLEHGRARARMPRTLILEPTRELAAQVQDNFDKYGVNHKLSVALLIGGVSFGDQDAKITRGVDVLIATPGRLLDHFERGKLLLTGVELLVIDEADRMLDMGFIPDIERIVKLVPFTRQTLFFSATMPPEIQRLADAFLHNPVKVEVARAASTAATITQRLVATGREDWQKRETLRNLINAATDLKNAVVFCNRKRDVAVLHRSLQKHGFGAVALHGDMDQHARMAALDSFRSGEMPILVASDVAARGLDIPSVSHVFNYDVPHHAEDYVHRIGRTGRAGRTGYSFTLVSPSDEKSLGAIEKLIGTSIEWEGPTLAELPPSEGSSSRRRGGRGERSERGERGEERSSRSRKVKVRSGDRQRSRGEDAREEAAPVNEAPAPQQEQEPRRSRPERQPQPRGDQRRSRREDDNEPSVKGMGDHMPAFLMRPVTIKKSS
ncbi:DEAD/DEAH box helicase [Microvirga sp. ACRRW]|uniref:DEAD/DEAH box helicase n=1 Tax=Microvirga sp. ACRRW TaxID=2918205 RepID=UPI001EF65A1F|nr:DEAD/DEAH box helicase [Microvirga sp. ACRRW]MCG7394194.1 DEAD/DEAH box helicase [Microvirga sp. ACRRW]